MSNTIPPHNPTGPDTPSSDDGESYVSTPTESAYQPPADTYTPQPSKAKKSSGLGSAIAAAVITSLIVGGGAGYLAASTVQSGQEPSSAPLNSLEQPAIKSAQEAPDGSVEQVAAAVLPAVVSIEVQGQRGSSEGSGSIVSSDGYVVTNHHVIEAASDGQARITVTLNDGSRHEAKYVASDVNTDVGVIKIQSVSDLPVLEFGNSEDLRVGQQVVAVGSPLGLSATVTSGIVSALNRPVRAGQGGGESSLMDGIQTDAAINPGNSGGPLVDMEGRLVGMNSVIASLSSGGFGGQPAGGSIGLGFAIPSNFAQRVAQQLIDTGEAKQPMLGVQVNVLESGTDGATIAQVQPDSPAAAAGLQVGETITRVGDRMIDSADALIAATRSHNFGETVTLEVRSRDNQTRTVEVTLSSE